MQAFDRVLVQAAAGGVGHFAVQIAAARGERRAGAQCSAGSSPRMPRRLSLGVPNA